MVEIRNACRILVGEHEDLGDLGVDGRTMLNWIVLKYVGNVWIGFIWLMIGIGGGLL